MKRRVRRRLTMQEEALRLYLRGVLPPREAVEAERMLDAVLEQPRRKDLEPR